MSTFGPSANVRAAPPGAEPTVGVLSTPRTAAATRSPAAVRAEQRAWVILWLAFATFCALAIAGTRLAVHYVTTAEIPLTARVEAARGLVFVQGPARPKSLLPAGETELVVGTTVEALRPAEVAVRFFDNSRMTVLPGASVELTRMDVGRFIRRQTLVLRQTTGPVRYETSAPSLVEVPHGQVRLSSDADVTVWVDAEQTRVRVYAGEATITLGDVSQIIPAEFRGELTADLRVLGPVPRAEQLLANGDFTQRTVGWDEIDVQNGPQDVFGQRFFVQGPAVVGSDGPHTALRVVRNSASQAHGETGLRQDLNINVAGFRSLYLEAWVRVDNASLSGGGQLGSEYPMMLRLLYEGPREGSRPDWLHGFYYANPENRPVINAQQVPQGEWVAYRVNLLDQEEPRRPFQLLGFEVMGQGHSYDARVADIRLVGD